MSKKFIGQQQNALKQVVKNGVGTSLFAHLGLIGLKKFKDFDLLHQAFAQSVPVHSPQGFQEMLTEMTRIKGDASSEIIDSLAQKNLTTKMKLAGLCYWKGGVIPVTHQTLNTYYAYEKDMFTQLAGQGIKPKGLTFTLFEREKGHVHGATNLPVTGWNRLIQENRSFFGRQRFLPSSEKLHNATGSRFQWLNAMLEALKADGKKVETLIAHPATLVDFALFTAQQEGRFVPLSDLCPNLKVFLYTSNSLSPYRTELAYFFKNLGDVRWVQFFHNPAGLFAGQRDINIRDQLSMHASTDTFYEFVPEEDVLPDGTFHQNYRRLHAGQLQAKRRYAVLASNSAGLIGVDLRQLVFVKSLEPFRISFIGNPKRLATLNENLYEHDIATAIDGINTALTGQGVFIRSFLFASQQSNRQPQWVLEISRPVESINEELLQGIADRLKGELALKNTSLREMLQNPNVRAVDVIFVPMGTLAAIAGERRLPKLDHTADAQLVAKVISSAWSVRQVKV